MSRAKEILDKVSQDWVDKITKNYKGILTLEFHNLKNYDYDDDIKIISTELTIKRAPNKKPNTTWIVKGSCTYSTDLYSGIQKHLEKVFEELKIVEVYVAISLSVYSNNIVCSEKDKEQLNLLNSVEPFVGSWNANNGWANIEN